MTAPQRDAASQEWLRMILNRDDLEPIDESRIEFGPKAISEANPHRFEMALLSGVIAFRPADELIVGVKDVTANEFWGPGHLLSDPVFPPVLMIEVVAQLCSFYWVKTHPTDRRSFILGGLNAARFHSTPVIGDRLIVIAKAVDMNPRKALFDTAGFVTGKRVFEATIVGMAMRLVG